MSSEKWSARETKDTPVDDDQGLLLDSGDSDNNKRFKLGNLPLHNPNTPEWTISTSYKVDDVVRILGAENMICKTAHTSSPTAFPAGFNDDNNNWKPVRFDIETGVLETNFKTRYTATLVGNGSGIITATITGTLPFASDYFEVGDHVSTIDFLGTYSTGNPSPASTMITEIITETNFKFTIAGNMATSTSMNTILFNNTAVDVGSTKGIIVDNSDLTQPIVSAVDENPKRHEFTTNFLYPNQIVYVDSAGVLNAQRALTTTIETKTANMVIGFMGAIVGTTELAGVQVTPNQFYQKTINERFNEIAAAAKVYPGGEMSEGASGLTINFSEGVVYYPGAGYQFDVNQPDTRTVAAQSPVPLGSYLAIHQTGAALDDAAFSFLSNSLDVDNYNPTTSIVAIPTTGPQFQIFRVYLAVSFTHVYYGRELYNSVDEARSRIDNDNFVEKTTSKASAFRGYIIAKRGISSWSSSTSGTDYLFLPKPEEYSLDRGNPQNRSLGLTQQQLQADIANESTGSIEQGLISLSQNDISSIVGNDTTDDIKMTAPGGTDYTIIFSLNDKIRINGTDDYDGDYQVEAVISGLLTVTATDPGEVVDIQSNMTVSSLHLIDIDAGSGQIIDHSTPNNFFRNQVNWTAESQVDLTSNLANNSIYILKDLDGITKFITKTSDTITAEEIRNDILLGVVNSKQGFTNSVDSNVIWSLENQRIAIPAPRSQIDDFRTELYFTKSGAETIEANPTTDFTMGRNSGKLVGRGLNFSINNESPNVFSVGPKSLISFFRIDRDGFRDSEPTLQTEPNNVQFDEDGTVTNINPSGRFSVQRLWCEPELDQYLLQYGTAIYASSDIESAAYVDERPPNPPGLTNSAFVISSLIMTGDSSNWDNNADQIILAGDITGGTTVSSSGGGSASDTPWTETHNAAGFRLENVGDIRIYDNAKVNTYRIVGQDDMGEDFTITLPVVKANSFFAVLEVENVFTKPITIQVPSTDPINFSSLTLKTFDETSNNGSHFQGFRARGTSMTSTPIQNDDYISVFEASGYDGTVFIDGGEIVIKAGGNWTGTSHPTEIDFLTTDTTGSQETRMQILPSGDVILNENLECKEKIIGTAKIDRLIPTLSLEKPAVTEIAYTVDFLEPDVFIDLGLLNTAIIGTSGNPFEIKGTNYSLGIEKKIILTNTQNDTIYIKFPSTWNFYGQDHEGSNSLESPIPDGEYGVCRVLATSSIESETVAFYNNTIP